MATPTTTADRLTNRPGSRSAEPKSAEPSSLARAGHALTQGLGDVHGHATAIRDAVARRTMRIAVLVLEVVALAFVLGGLLGVVQQLGTADSFGLSLFLPVLAIVLVAGFFALMSLAIASALLVLVRLSGEVEAMKTTIDAADRDRPRGGDADEGGSVAA